MTEAFVGYTNDHPFDWLERTLLAWDDIPGCEPVAIECPREKYELFRRITASKMANKDYLLVDIGCLPVEEDTIKILRKNLRPDIGMVGASMGEQTSTDVVDSLMGVRLCRKIDILRWPKPETQNYSMEHSEAYRLLGLESVRCAQAHYTHILVS